MVTRLESQMRSTVPDDTLFFCYIGLVLVFTPSNGHVIFTEIMPIISTLPGYQRTCIPSETQRTDNTNLLHCLTLLNYGYHSGGMEIIHTLSMQLYTFLPRMDLHRPQRSCGKVMFLQVCVKNSVHRGDIRPSACWGADTPLTDTKADTRP